MANAPHVMFAGGGAAGHLFPGIAVASHLAKQMPEAHITFAGPGTARERQHVASAGYHYTTIPSQPPPQNPLQAIRFVTDNVAGYCAARWTLREQQISLVVGLGGHTSTAAVRAAAVRGIPYVLLEQNAIPSGTTRWLSRSAALVCAAFDEIRPHLDVQARVLVTGNPARPAFEHRYRSVQAKNKTIGEQNIVKLNDYSANRTKRLVVLGGAGGARTLNESMPAALKQLGIALTDWQIVHQTGEGQLQETEQRYRQAGVNALAVTFLDEIASVLFASELVVCRAGGTTLAELALAGVPAILVPYPNTSDDHQLANAKIIAATGACRQINELLHPGSLASVLAKELSPLLVDDALRHTAGQNMKRLARPQAAADIAAAIQDCIYGSQGRRVAA